ncbi:hypothetical protein P170DRAFT_456004 [Aspergillus steynii IBT 23096]|uniref:Probable beta-glucosidase E n=1 Tax=Aspergillus steynii IBT 23096 TaxID=1392250 RepID=A0A2I2G8Z2_9EURO|nr:uncharacterized protein P170DRAFT_456004 [Aspergillus steynii IBT 23096]PLB49355.1 hypothetical protein P170DRAFT_456004 [Aspergillus steynii IBT 23096]
MPPALFRDNNQGSSSQRYAPVQDGRYSDDDDSLPLSDPSDAEDNSDVKLRRLDRSTHSSRSGKDATAYAARNSTDVEAYLGSITEAEQELLSASRQYELSDGEDTDGYGHPLNKGRFLHGRRRSRQQGWRAVYYSKFWWRTLVGVIIALALLVWGFLSFAWSKGEDRPDYSYFPSESYFPTPRGGVYEEWAEDYRKAQLLVERMTLVEKINITTGTGWKMGLCVGNTGAAHGVKFPSLCLQDGPMGIRYSDHVSAFPAGLTTGATWNRDLMHKRGVALGQEARGKGINVLLGPSMGPLGMMPAGGRNWESFGSDPVLQGVAAAETIRGIQSNGVMATAKHYVMNEQEHFRQPHEWGVPHALSSNIGDRALHEVFVWPFAESIRADVASVMCAYQMVNNSHSCENSKLLNGILKDELGFQGFVQSDWLAQRSGINSALGGLDMSMPGDGLHWEDGKSLWGSELTRAVLNISIPMERLNDMVTRIVAAWYHLGQDTWPLPRPDGDGGPNFSSWTDDEVGWLQQNNARDYDFVNRYVDVQGEGEDAHMILIRKIGAEGTVLVKNQDNTLPLSRSPVEGYKVGIFGDDAGPAMGPNVCEDRACSSGTLATGWGSGTVEFPYLVAPQQAIEDAWDHHVETTSYLRNAVMPADAADKDLCLVFANANSGEGYKSYGGIHGDRPNLFLQRGGDTLIQTVANNCGNGNGRTVVVIHAVGPVVVEPWIDLPGVHAVLFAHLPGQESGSALIDVMFGDLDASGRLPYTVGKSLEDYGPGAQVLYEPNGVVPQVNFSDSLYIDHRHFDRYNITPRFEFGFGLSYTSFEMSDLNINVLQPKSSLPSASSVALLPPPEYNTTIPSNESFYFPDNIVPLARFIYPYLPDLDGTLPKNYTHYPDGYGLPYPPSPAGGGLGGNPSLYDEIAKVQVRVKNTGKRPGQTVIQVYVGYPDDVIEEGDLVPVQGEEPSDPNASEDPNQEPAQQRDEIQMELQQEHIDFPDRVLRNFTKIELQPGEVRPVELTLTRKDLSYWSSRQQNWVMPEGEHEVLVGFSSRNFPVGGKF